MIASVMDMWMDIECGGTFIKIDFRKHSNTKFSKTAIAHVLVISLGSALHLEYTRDTAIALADLLAP